MADHGRQDRRRATEARSFSQTGMRLYNERLLLALIRTHGALSRAELTRLTGLSAQACSVIIKQLEQDGLLLRGERVKAGVGQPSIPMIVDPEGAFSIGIKIGRRTTDVLLMDFVGGRWRLERHGYAYPTPSVIEDWLPGAVERVLEGLAPDRRDRVCGVGVAVPSELWSWQEEAGLAPEAVDLWHRYDIVANLRRHVRLPVSVCNDATAACAAELVFGNKEAVADYLYIFVGTLIGGGIVLDGSLYTGRAGYAGAIGSMPVGPRDAQGRPRHLIQVASISLLERALMQDGLDAAALLQAQDWREIETHVARWIATAAAGISAAIAGAVSVIDFQCVIVDGALPADTRRRLVEAVQAELATTRRDGIAPYAVREGSVGRDARVIGAASLPLLERFYPDHGLLRGLAPEEGPTRRRGENHADRH